MKIDNHDSKWLILVGDEWWLKNSPFSKQLVMNDGWYFLKTMAIACFTIIDQSGYHAMINHCLPTTVTWPPSQPVELPQSCPASSQGSESHVGSLQGWHDHGSNGGQHDPHATVGETQGDVNVAGGDDVALPSVSSNMRLYNIVVFTFFVWYACLCISLYTRSI